MNRTRRRWFHITLALLAIAGVSAAGGCGPSTTTTPESSMPPNPVENGVVVQLVQGQGCDPEKGDLKRGNGKDHVRWHNPGSVERRITFTAGWPFMEAQAEIVIPAGGWSEWFSLAPAPVNGDYPYQVNPTLRDPGQPPEGPVISAGD